MRLTVKYSFNAFITLKHLLFRRFEVNKIALYAYKSQKLKKYPLKIIGCIHNWSLNTHENNNERPENNRIRIKNRYECRYELDFKNKNPLRKIETETWVVKRKNISSLGPLEGELNSITFIQMRVQHSKLILLDDGLDEHSFVWWCSFSFVFYFQ